MNMSSKVFAVTGGASGMGAATCRLLAERGAYAICVGDVSPKGFEALRASIAAINPSVKLRCKILDVASSTSVDEWISDIISVFGELHGVANIAGLPQAIGERGVPAILEETDEEWRRILNVNLDGIFYCTRSEIKAMKNLPSANRAIVNVSSMASLQHNPDVYAYRTSKAACAHFTTSAAKDTTSLGIRINCVSPGLFVLLLNNIIDDLSLFLCLLSTGVTDTPMLGSFIRSADQVQEGWIKKGWNLMSAEDVARVVVWLLSDDSIPVFGSNINVGAGLP
ncbi:chanoclavine-I dehydrogenase [Penicillium cosmopolitanum]|uniref:Chanoclavine-I dehydrogenase n=1 Tax=Penicillium cosmopolitanum TaxID=1131564 RepID=A0A9W9SGW2_9EURO|nr:chanoclavine-I dehydrogenase [Penicillium cosmopolitanum]KAJ5378381.1 chanoclavine-I dehydrogenase [Penicillium cosmopolitanum]